MATDHRKPVAYELVEAVKGASALLLYANGQGCVCPFSPMQMIQGPKGEVLGQGRTTCNSGCPLASIDFEKEPCVNPDDEESIMIYAVSCGAAPVRRRVTLKAIGLIEQLPGSGIVGGNGESMEIVR